MENCTRKTTSPVRVYCLPEERAQLRATASATRKSLSAYLLNVAPGYPSRRVLYERGVDELLRVNGALGRLGGLLKQWLTNDERPLPFARRGTAGC